jgi:glutamate-ammonia-ligase adenylyltransferase
VTEFERALVMTGLPQALRGEVARYWEAFGVAAGEVGVEPPAGALLEQMLRVWACSEFVARACIREPAALAELLAGGELAATHAPGECTRRGWNGCWRTRRTRPARGGAAPVPALGNDPHRLARSGRAGRIGGNARRSDRLGGALVDAALERLHAWQCQRYGQPRDADGQPQRLVVLGMGKLGGRELNFSSDIDLIFTYPRQGQTDGARAVSNEEFFRRLGQRLGKILAEPTADGFVFRVDLRCGRSAIRGRWRFPSPRSRITTRITAATGSATR